MRYNIKAMEIIIEKVVVKENHYGKVKSQTSYEVLGKRYYPCQGWTIGKIKKMLRDKGYQSIRINDRGITFLN